MSLKSVTFKQEKDGKEVEFEVRRPNMQQIREANRVYMSEFRDSINPRKVGDQVIPGALVKAKLNDFLIEQGLWSQEKEIEYTRLRQEVLDNERKLSAGGIKLSDARKLALDTIALRNDFRELVASRTQYENMTAEGQAENSKFNYLVSVCLVYNETKEPYFATFEDYLNSQADPIGLEGARRLMGLLYDVDGNPEAKLPEYKFLKQYGFINDKLQLIDKDGHLITIDGKRINDKGQYVNDADELVDENGHRIDAEGNYVVEFKPFLDDEGNEVVLAPQEAAVEVPTETVEQETSG